MEGEGEGLSETDSVTDETNLAAGFLGYRVTRIAIAASLFGNLPPGDKRRIPIRIGTHDTLAAAYEMVETRVRVFSANNPESRIHLRFLRRMDWHYSAAMADVSN